MREIAGQMEYQHVTDFGKYWSENPQEYAKCAHFVLKLAEDFMNQEYYSSGLDMLMEGFAQMYSLRVISGADGVSMLEASGDEESAGGNDAFEVHDADVQNIRFDAVVDAASFVITTYTYDEGYSALRNRMRNISKCRMAALFP